MKVKYRIAHSMTKGEIKVPVIDVRDGNQERVAVNRVVKESNGNDSKYVPGKWGYGAFGPKKY